MIEGINGATYTSNIAIDDVAILQGENCSSARFEALEHTPIPADECKLTVTRLWLALAHLWLSSDQLLLVCDPTLPISQIMICDSTLTILSHVSDSTLTILLHVSDSTLTNSYWSVTQLWPALTRLWLNYDRLYCKLTLTRLWSNSDPTLTQIWPDSDEIWLLP